MAKVLLKKSSVPSNVPGTGDLDYGEIAINYADGRLYYKNSSNQIKHFIDSDGVAAIIAAGATGLAEIVQDATPQLGGNLETNGNDITFSDNDKALFGTGSDLRIYHDGSNSYISDSGTGSLYIKSDGAGGVWVQGRDVASDGTKLDGIEANATADQTAAEILTLIKTVDGSGSGLDADTLDGQHGTYYQPASTALTTSTTFGGDVSGTYNAIVVADNSHNHIISNVDGLQTALDAKAPLASPALTGTPTAPTAGAGTNTTQIATTAFVGTAVSNLVDAAPGTLDTLNELAAALGDDPNFATTVSNSIATKLPLAGGQMTGNITFSGAQTVDGRDLSVDGAKLDGIEAGATADQTASEILTAIKTVDGAASGLDADTLDGQHGSYYRIDVYDASGTLLN